MEFARFPYLGIAVTLFALGTGLIVPGRANAYPPSEAPTSQNCEYFGGRAEGIGSIRISGNADVRYTTRDGYFALEICK